LVGLILEDGKANLGVKVYEIFFISGNKRFLYEYLIEWCITIIIMFTDDEN